MIVTFIRANTCIFKLDLCSANKVDIRNQRPRLRRNRLILVNKAGGFCRTAPVFHIYSKIKF